MELRYAIGSMTLFAVAAFVSGKMDNPGNLPDSSAQLLVVTTPDWNAVEGTLARYERSTGGKAWRSIGGTTRIVVGESGLAWGEGIMPEDHASTDPVKREGDDKAPAGAFRLSSAFGYAPEERSGWKMPYIALTQSTECVDDAKSKYYNRILDRSAVSPDWSSSEHMLRPDDLYRWGLVVDYNVGSPKPGAGSCVFLHIWRAPNRGTVGCTAMSPESMETLLAWLDPAKQPLLVQLPAAEYDRMRQAWGLPKPPEFAP